jgi:hypothetical protein
MLGFLLVALSIVRWVSNNDEQLRRGEHVLLTAYR